jgi:hypothetical protein
VSVTFHRFGEECVIMSTSRSLLQAALVVGAAASVLAASSLLQAQNPADQAAAAKRPQPDMQAMGRGFRTISTQIKDQTKNESSLALLSQMEQSSLSAKDAMPPLVTGLPDADRGAKLVAYKKEMVKLIRQELDLEEQLLDGNNAKAADTVAALNATMQEGHTDFRPARGRGPGAAGPGRGAGATPPAGRQ